MLRIDRIHKSFGSRTLLDGVSARVQAGDRIGLVGRNGEGKTTLLRILGGMETADDGRVVLEGDARLGYLRQEVDPTSETAVIDEARTALEPLRVLEGQLAELEARMAETQGEVPEALAARYDAVRHEFERKGGFGAESRLRGTLAGLGLGEDRWQRPLRTLSGGWLMRVELAKLLLARPDVLLLDEPTNHLDLPSIRWFEGVLASYPGAVIVVSHDRIFLDRHATRILELDRGQLTSFPGNYSAYERRKAERVREAKAHIDSLDRQIAHAQKFVERFSAKATKAAQANSRKKQIEKLRAERDALVPRSERRGMALRFPPVPRSGDVVVRLEGVAKSFAETRVYRSLDLELRRGDRIALVGPNGAGKSTLLRLIAGSLEADAGSVELGHNVIPAFYAQHQLEALDRSKTVLEELESGAPLDEIPRLRSLLGAFLFSGDDVDKKVSVLSGGERARLALAKLLLGGANFLILDEPTNHLDMQAREVASAALDRFRGTLLFISHDRSLINSLANRVLEVMPGPDEARTRMLIGGWDDYERSLEQLEDGSARPASRREARAARAAEKEVRRERERKLRGLRNELERTESEIEDTERAWEANNTLSSDPEALRDGTRMQELTRARRELEWKLADLNEAWERLGHELETMEAAEPG
jgi:ATP-binding cassette subfamily F protein 3